MWNPMPGPEREGVRCKERPGRPVFDVPLGGNTEKHAHVTVGGITFQCDGELEEAES